MAYVRTSFSDMCLQSRQIHKPTPRGMRHGQDKVSTDPSRGDIPEVVFLGEVEEPAQGNP